MVTIKDGCGCDPCDCDWKQKLKEAYSRAIQSVNKIGDETGRVYYPDGTGFVKVPLPTTEQIDSLAQIDTIKASVDELNKAVPALEVQLTGVTESLVSNVEVLNGTTAGKFKVRIEREKAALIDSNDYDLSKVNSIELIQGSGPAMVKAQLTLSDGTVLRSDDFLFTTESIGTDVYISSFTFKAGNVDGTISADIGLNNGTTLEANNFVVPTDPSVVSTITDLQTRMSAVENGSGVNGLDALKVTVETHTTEITQLTNDVGDLMTSKVDVAQGTENAGKVLGIGEDGNVTPTEAGGSTVIPCPLNYVEFFNSLQLGSEIYGESLDFLNNDTDTIARFYNFNFKCVTNNNTDGIYIIGQAYKTQMVLGNNTTLYRNSVTIVFKSGKVTITVEGGTNETASSSIIVKRSQFLPMSTINTNVFIRV